MAGTVIADRLEATSTSQLVIENGVANTPPTIADVNGTQVGTFCRAWVNFNGTGTVAIRASFNVSSITDGGVGIYTVNFTNALADAAYAEVTAGGNDTVSGSSQTCSAWAAGKTAGSFVLNTVNASTYIRQDFAMLSVAVFD